MNSVRNRAEVEYQWDPASGIPPITIHTQPLCKGPRTPQKRKNATASRDQKRDVRMADRCGLNTNQIMEMLRLIRRQVLYALETPVTPKKPTGRPPVLDAEQRQHLVDFVCASRKNRRMSYQQLAHEFRYWEVGHKGIKAALEREGFNLR
jgi:hypothetical protein